MRFNSYDPPILGWDKGYKKSRPSVRFTLKHRGDLGLVFIYMYKNEFTRLISVTFHVSEVSFSQDLGFSETQPGSLLFGMVVLRYQVQFVARTICIFNKCAKKCNLL